MKTNRILLTTMAVLAGILMSAPTAKSIMIGEDQGGRATWEGLVVTSTDVDLAGQVAEFATLGSGSPLALPSGKTLTFSADLLALQVGNSWATWSSGAPRVLYSQGLDSVTATVGGGVLYSFGLEMQPNILGLFSMTLATGEILTQVVDGDGGAKFFGWINEPVVSFTMSAVGTDFAFGNMVEGPGSPVPGVPDGGSLTLVTTLLWVGLLGLGKLRRISS